MKEYKIETLIFNQKLTFDLEEIAKSSQKGIQEKLDEYSKKGYQLCSTDSTKDDNSLYVNLYFEKNIK